VNNAIIWNSQKRNLAPRDFIIRVCAKQSEAEDFIIYAAAGPVLSLAIIAIMLGMNTHGVDQGTTLITGMVLAVIASCILFWLHSRTR
jgi:hypothetical protein